MPETGRAAVFTGVGSPFELREYPVPDPGDRDLVIKVSRANICGSDLHLWRGDTNLAAMGLTYGIILGHEMCGVVARTGSKVRTDSLGKRLREGDRVAFSYYVPCGRCPVCLKGAPHMCMSSLASPVRSCDQAPHFLGGFADYYYLKSRQWCFVAPDEVDDSMLAGANCALSQVLYGLERARFGFGETIVIQGAGGLGLMACAVAREMGAAKIIAIDGVPARLELAKQFGADEVIDINAVPDRRARTMAVMAATGGWGADVVVEVVGKPDVVNEGIRMLARGGRYLELGNINAKQTFKCDPSLLVGYNREIIGVSLYPPDVLQRAVAFLARNKARFPFGKLLSHSYALEDIDDAFAQSDTEGARCGDVARASIVMGAEA